MAKKESKFLKQQKFAVGALAVVVLAIVAYLSYQTTIEANIGEFVEGEHYRLIENPRRIRGDEIEVMEFFSYACVHCYNFDPLIKAWAEGRDDVNLVQTPAIANEYWRLLGRHYYALEDMDALEEHHMRAFRAIHDARQVFNGPERMIQFAESSGLDRRAYEQAFNSTEVSTALNRADQMARRLRVAAVPTIIVQGKYLVRTTSDIGPRRMLQVIDHLVGLEKAQETSG
ncbi:MAG: thiol:disulfide interchange protein DsbA/DsbL [Pseudomonadales bacterium]|nr:thiol:disulfide interchange protein DsbA/DsbL [Pseudomonadales bacterium]MBO6700922.1 thiol:disulfide interchange protein DsbA/DsbL [Pseudomonadales bacterium]MBO7005948.1 thiol:disulfide interchange protein DsbA/DsbL [Pseudomonadales bacterium]